MDVCSAMHALLVESYMLAMAWWFPCRFLCTWVVEIFVKSTAVPLLIVG